MFIGEGSRKINLLLAMSNATYNYTRCETKNCLQNNTLTDFQSSICITLTRTILKGNPEPAISKVLSIAVNLVSSIFATITNTLVITVLSKKHVFRTGANLILTSMAVSDLLVGAIVQPFQIVYTLYDILGKDWCSIKSTASFLASFCVMASLMNTCFFALDRCFAAIFPYLYLEEIIYKKYLKTIVIGWLSLTLLVILAMVEVMQKSVLLNVLKCLYFLSLVSICVSYVVVFFFIRAQIKKIKSLAPVRRKRYIIEDFGKHKEDREHPTNGNNKIIVISNEENIEPDLIAETSFSASGWSRNYNLEKREINDQKKTWQEKKKALKKQTATSRTVFVIIGVFTLCYLPITVFDILKEMTQLTQLKLHLIHRWTNVPIILNSSLNPIIYCIRVKTIRHEVRKLIKLGTGF